MSADALPRTFSPADVAQILGVAKGKVLGFIGDGELRAVDVRSAGSSRARYRITEAALTAFLEARGTGPPARPAKRPRGPQRHRNGQVIEFF